LRIEKLTICGTKGNARLSGIGGEGVALILADKEISKAGCSAHKVTVAGK
jgi:hypothetical protein